jgi:hypothetical protein
MTISAGADVPTSISATNVPPDVVSRAHVAVPVAAAVPAVVVLNVSVPLLDAGASVAPHVTVASNVVAVPPVAGREPV